MNQVRVLVILSSAEAGKARTGALYAVNAVKNHWLDDVRLFVFGPAQRLLLEDAELQTLVAEFGSLSAPAVACRFFAERDEQVPRTRELGLTVEYVGEPISALLRRGYLPMIW